MSVTAIMAIAVFVAAYVLIAMDKLNRAAVALSGAAAMVVIGATRGEFAFFGEDTGVDWNVIFLLLGMMVIVGILRRTGVFEYLAITAAQSAKGRPFRMMVLLVLTTALASALLDNVTTVLLIAPVTLLVCNQLGLDPVSFLLAEVMASNIGGTATLIGDPPNIIIGSRAGLGFNDFLVHMGPIVLMLLVLYIGLAWLLWGRKLQHDEARAAQLMKLKKDEAITDRPLLIKMIVVLALVLAGFIAHSLTHVEPSVVALLGAGAAIALSRQAPAEYLEEVEWETLLFFSGLFIMVGTLVHQGVIGQLASLMASALGDQYLLGAQLVLLGSALFSGIVDNIPFVATMSPLVYGIVGSASGLPPQQQSLWWALALGADLGGNATLVGASANVVVTGIAKRNGHPITFWTFSKYGLPVTIVTILACVPYLALRYFVFAG
jgi:Na+/H+ antiporter NhaD/arsenite permease-like protein